MDRVFLRSLDCPFRAIDALLDSITGSSLVVVDFHAEATSEQEAMGWYLNGLVSAIAGTHTHVATANERILPNGTAYVTDVGIVGPLNSTIGSESRDLLARFLYQVPRQLSVADWPVRWNSVFADVDDEIGHSTNIRRLDRVLE